MDNRIADANKKTQSAPQPEEVENLIWTFRCDLRRATPGDVSEMLLTLVNADDLHKAINLISDLTRRLAEAEVENGRFAGMLEDSVSGWRKLYTEERAERVRIEDILLNDVQADRQESDEHIKGLDTVIKTQDKTIRDLKSRVVELAADWQVQFAKAEAAEARVRELEAFKARVMEWAHGRCGCCEHRDRPRTCDACWTCTDHEDKPNWTPPQAWEVGE